MAARGVGRLSVGRAAESSRFTPRAVKHTRLQTAPSPAEDSAGRAATRKVLQLLCTVCKLAISKEI